MTPLGPSTFRCNARLSRIISFATMFSSLISTSPRSLVKNNSSIRLTKQPITAKHFPKALLTRMKKRVATPLPSSSSSAGPGKKQRMSTAIKLSLAEEKLFSFLLDVASQPRAKGAVLRVAGGWVRDKLLGRDSDDVDIALDVMTGRAFADLINDYENAQGREARAVGVIKANPEQSKHLETATMQMRDNFGWVDFVNLRAETYASEDTRIPVVAFGTPQQDAERRDFTINALFYNLVTKQVEDFTGRGICDLQTRHLRTPLDPRVTFLDDPLRVLRAVRFASRFNCVLDDDLRAAAQMEEVRVALVRKVSRERVGKEVCAMLTGSAAYPERAVQLLHELGLCESVFLPPALLEKMPVCRADGEPENIGEHAWGRSYAYVSEMCQLMASGDVLDVDSLTSEKKQELHVRILACVLLPSCGLCVRDKRRRSTAAFVVQDALKLPNRDAKDVENVLAHVRQLQTLTLESFNRLNVGLLIRSIGAQWDICCNVALVQELVNSGPVCDSADARATVSKRYDTFMSYILDSGLDSAWKLKPLLDGNDLMEQLGVKPGPQVKELLDRVIAWQLVHPAKTRDDCMLHFKASVVDEAQVPSPSE